MEAKSLSSDRGPVLALNVPRPFYRFHTNCSLRYRQEAYLYKNKIFIFGGGGATGISFSLEHVSRK